MRFLHHLLTAQRMLQTFLFNILCAVSRWWRNLIGSVQSFASFQRYGASESIVDFVPQEVPEKTSTPRRGGVARVMSTVGRAAAKFSPPRYDTAYQRLETPDVSYDADVSSVESFMAVRRGSPGLRYRPCEDTPNFEESFIGSPDGRVVGSTAGDSTV